MSREVCDKNARVKRACGSFVIVVLLVLVGSAALAQGPERILLFRSDVSVMADSTVLVTETITVVSAGQQIRHGIYRDFPTDYRDRFGNHYDVHFTALAAERDGSPERFRSEKHGNGVRVYIGDPAVLVPPGRHVYALTYTASRELGFFADHDELYWNATGNGWDFTIEHATATVHLPAQLPAEKLKWTAYTGVQGARGSNWKARVEESGAVNFATTAPLRPREGLSIVVEWPKGLIAEPTPQQKLAWLLADNRSAAIGAVGVAGIFLYYFFAWIGVGRDPKGGSIMPQYAPPKDFSPAAMRYLWRMSYDHKAFAADVVNMAVKKYLRIEKQTGALTNKSYVLWRADKSVSESALTPDEQIIAKQLLGDHPGIVLDQGNHVTIAAALKAFQKWLSDHEEKTYFFTNTRWLAPGLVLSAVTMIAMALAEGGQAVPVSLFMSVWLTFWTFGVVAILTQVVRLWRGAASSALSAGGALFLTLFSLPFLGGEVMGMFMLQKAVPGAPVVVITLGALAVLFHYLLKRPTAAGRLVLDQIAGFKMFLEATEQDRMNRMSPLDKTPETFEKFLPYAMALDIEQRWAEQFAGVLGAAAVAGSAATAYAYTPAWYSGDVRGLGDFTSSLGNSLSGAIASSSTAPGSSSGGGGGGGGSGGGGGGGGGGGW